MKRSIFFYILLLLLPVAVVAPYFMRKDIPLDLQMLAGKAPWSEAWGEITAADEVSDVSLRHGMQTYPWYRFIHEAGQEGFLPLWNDDEGAGYPFLAAWRTRALSPFSLPFYFLPLEYAFWVSALLKLVIAGWSMQFFARRLGLTPSTAACAALAYQWSGGVYGAFDIAVSDVLAWLPLLLLGLDGIARLRPYAWAAGALALGLMLLGGAPEFTLPLSVGGVLFVGVRGLLFAGKAAQLQITLGIGLWLIVGAAFAMVQWWPYLEFLHYGNFTGLTEKVPEWPGWLPFITSVLLFPKNDVPAAQLFYPGYVQWLLLPLWLAVRTFSEPEARRSIESLLVVAGLMAVLDGLCILYPALPAAFGVFAPRFSAYLIVPALGLASAKAISVWIRLDPDEAKTAVKWLLCLMPIFWGIAFAPAVLSFSAFNVTEISIVLGVAGVIFAVLVITLLHPRRALFSSVVCISTFGILLFGNQPEYKFTPSSKVFPETGFIQSLRQVDGRITGSEVLQTWPLSGNGISQLYPTSGICLQSIKEAIEGVAVEPRRFREFGVNQLFAVREDIQGSYADLRPELAVKNVFESGAVLFTDLHGKEQAWIVGQEGIDSVVVERSTNPNNVLLRLNEPYKGELVFTDAYYPGWQVKSETGILPIQSSDGLFRNVAIDSDSTELHFEFQSKTFRIGGYISTFSFLIISIGLVLFWRRYTQYS